MEQEPTEERGAISWPLVWDFDSLFLKPFLERRPKMSVPLKLNEKAVVKPIKWAAGLENTFSTWSSFGTN